ncbi:integrating conjugative element protein%2C PFL_4695 family [Legionella pneumophila]|uniref:PFL_4695 family integrating conjugative element protein n=1 Tax=Legionella pneumophila TaxID=446 RepID=UPI000770B7A8|nr:integrating conjugative element protein [Legionella pneumophila]CZP77439.1 integrating conjugative element protein%2C PFL_4695 family [Legionella pneumophila]CZQ07301.1 integrating conjugative element protein%2C PFL_4695 family [Legionella pneumophila]HDV5821445.1 integrating conjugative element protein [Legionella pneumophila]
MMRVLFLMLIAINAFSLQVIPLTLGHSDTSNQLDLSSPIGVPAKSKAKFGKVDAKKIDTNAFHNVVFVIGADQLSKKWLTQHQRQLQDMQAIGFITNVDDFETIIQLQEQSQLPLLPVNVDPLMQLIDVKHYPIVIAEGEVWQ